MRGSTNVQIGSVTSASATAVIKNFSPLTAGTLVTGSDNASGAFAGVLASDYTSGVLSVTKIGTGNWNLGLDNSANILGTLQLSGGTVTLNSATARVGFVTTILSGGAALTLDNSGSVLNDRLGGTISVVATTADRAFSNRGGVLNFIGGASAGSEALNVVTNLEGMSTWTLTPGTAATSLNVTTFTASTTTNRGGSYLTVIGGLLGGAAGSGRVNVIAAAPGVVSFVRPDIIGIDSSGTGLVTSDANGFRILTTADTTQLAFVPGASNYLAATTTPGYVTAVGGTVSNAATGSNAFLSASTALYGPTTINSLTLGSAGGVVSNGGGLGSALFSGSGLNTLTLAAGALLSQSGNAGLTGGAITAGANLLYLHTVGDLTVNSYVLGSGGVVKDGTGILTLSQKVYNTAQLFVNEGTVRLNAGINTLLVIPTATTATVADLVVNNGTLDLNGNSQAVARLTNTTGANFSANAGTVTNTSATAATLFINNPATTFAGVVSGNMSLDKTGANGLTLTSVSPYTGATNVRGGTLLLQDSAAITGGGAINANYAAISLVNSGLSHVAARLGTSAVSLTGGTLSFTPRTEGETAATLGALTLAGGTSTVNFVAQVGNGGSINLNGASLTQTAANGGTLLVTAGTGQIGRGVAATGGQSPQLTFTTAPTLTSSIIGGWATNNVEFLTYLSRASTTGAIGVGLLGDTGSGFTDYTGITLPAASTATGNYRIVAAGTVPTVASYTLNSLNIVGAFGLSGTLYTDVLFLGTGGLLKSGTTAAIGQNPDWLRVAAGAAAASAGTYNLYLTSAAATVNARIVNNGASALTRLVLSGTAATLTDGASSQALPGVLTAASGAVTMISTTGLLL